MNSKNFDLPNHMYISKLNRHKRIYEITINDIEDKLRQANQEIDAYNLKIRDGYKETPLICKATESIILFPEETKLHDCRDIYIDVMQNINKNTIISIYHFWERYWFDVIKGKEFDPEKPNAFRYKDFLSFEGIKKRVSKYRKLGNDIEKIKDIANALKHGNRKNIRVLLNKYPNLFPEWSFDIKYRDKKYKNEHEDFLICCLGSDAISIQRVDVEEAFEIISKSGP